MATNLFDLSGPTLVVAAHPDDESIGLGGTLPRLSDPLIVHLTDGAPRNTPDQAEYAAIRRNELESALAVAGIPACRTYRLGAVDQETVFVLDEIVNGLVTLMLEWRPGVVFVHPYEGGHPDHDTAAFAVAAAARGLPDPPLIFEYTSYHNGNPRSSPAALRSGVFLPASAVTEIAERLSPQACELKTRMFQCFQSQRHMLGSFSIDVERFRKAPVYDFTLAPHEGALYYEEQPWGMDGSQWRSAAAAFLGAKRHSSKS